MITYYKGAYGTNLLFQFHGSAVYRAVLPGLLSVLVFWLIRRRVQVNELGEDIPSFNHPYAVGVLVGSVSFLIVFRVNNSYQRYWEACGNVHQMMSKWLDATTHTFCFHMQCDHYDDIKPPSYFDYPELNNCFLTRYRERGLGSSSEKLSQVEILRTTRRRAVTKSIERVDKKSRFGSFLDEADLSAFKEEDPTPLTGPRRLDGGWGGLFPGPETTFYNKNVKWNEDWKGFASTAGGRTPVLFLQELAHLSSLMNAVALSTLRNDIEGAESPLAVFEPGAPWPEVDPSKIHPVNKRPAMYKLRSLFRHFMGSGRMPQARTKYNATRPLAVIGGVSDNEIRFLQMARGPYAKTQLCWNWLSEFVIREHLSGSTGKVGPPIISRIIQFLSDGMIYYNHARKIMQVPFPFPSAQLSAIYIFFMMFAVPVMMDQYAREAWLGALLTFFTVTCLMGLHEVARELENPFRNTPNDIPLVTFQAQYNEALLTMYAGYHPDAYWDPSSAGESKSTRSEDMANQSQTTSETSEEKNNDLEIRELRALLEKQGQEIKQLYELLGKVNVHKDLAESLTQSESE
jgi:predicted membrane chloride channel (bestrophin family)